VLACSLAAPVVWSLSPVDHPQTPDVVIRGAGATACRALTRDLGGAVADVRAVDAPTASRWLRAIGSPADIGSWSSGQPTTVCVLTARTTWRIALTQAGRRPLIVDRATDYRSVITTMTALDRLLTGGATITDAPFRCPGRDARPDQNVSSSLPSGATGALLCYDDGTLYSPKGILSSPGVEALLLAVDRAPLTYVAPHVTCGGIAGFRSYSIVFRYPSGTRTVSMEECRGLALGRFTRNAPSSLDLEFERFLPHGVDRTFGAPPPCPPPDEDNPRGVGDLRHIVRATYCPSGGTGPGQLLTGRRLADLVRWGRQQMPGSTEPEGACRRPPGGWPHFALLDTWGNTFTMTVECARGRYPAILSDDPHHDVFHPLNVAQPAFERLLTRLR